MYSSLEVPPLRSIGVPMPLFAMSWRSVPHGTLGIGGGPLDPPLSHAASTTARQSTSRERISRHLSQTPAKLNELNSSCALAAYGLRATRRAERRPTLGFETSFLMLEDFERTEQRRHLATLEQERGLRGCPSAA